MSDLQKFFKGKKVLVTGHTGFKGAWLCQILILWGAQVSGISLAPDTKQNMYSILNLKKKMSSHIADVRNFEKIKSIVAKEKPDIVFHLAAQPIVRESYDTPLYTVETNVMGTANMLEAIRFTPSVSAAVLITTDKVYEDEQKNKLYTEDHKLGGHDPYSASKAAAEIIISSYRKSFFNPDNYKKTHRTLIASVRAGNIIGGGDWAKDRIIPDFVKAVFEKGEPLVVRNPKAVRPWQYILHPLYGYLLISKELFLGNVEVSNAWNLGPSKKHHITVDKVLNQAIQHLGIGSFTISPDMTRHETRHLGLDSAKARKYLGWRNSFSVGDSIRWTIEWYKNYYKKGDPVTFTKNQIASFFKHEL